MLLGGGDILYLALKGI